MKDRRVAYELALVGESRRDRFLAFGAPAMLLVYSVIVLVIANAVSGTDSASASISPVIFTEEIIDPAGSAPEHTHTKSVGDIDGDGLPDIVVGGAGERDPEDLGQGLFWYQNSSGWTKFTIVPVDPASTGFSTDMQLGDVDGDGDLDVVVPRADNNGFIGEFVKWFENPRPAGDPTTDPWIEHHIGDARAHDVELGDLNNDGRLDVVVRFDTTHIFIQQGTPDDWLKRAIDGRDHEGLALGDFDDDGDLDVATNGYWLENPFFPLGEPAMDAIWTEWAIDTNRNDDGWGKVFASDVDQNGRIDVIINTSERPGGELAWYEPTNPADATGAWTKHSIGFVDYDHSIQTGDIDLDGDIDVIVAEMHQSSDPDNVLVFYNLDGTATSWDFQVVDTDGSHNIRVMDMDLDGDLDIVGANWSGGPVSLWRNNGLAPLDNWQRFAVDDNRPWISLFVESADVDGDNLKDIVTGGWWYKNPGTPGGVWQRNTIGSPLNNVAAVYDFDGDSDLDIVGTQGEGADSNSSFAWAENDGSGNFTVRTNIEIGDGDFLQGVEVGMLTSAQIEIYFSWHNGNPIQRLTVPADPRINTWTFNDASVPNQSEDLSQGDIDGDLDIDLLTGTRWLENDAGTWVIHTLFSPGGTPDRNELVDMNGDGRLDSVVGFEAISVAGKLAWYEQGVVATDLWTEHIISTTVIGPMSLDVRDMDGDGDFDVIVGEHNMSNPTAARLFVFENLDGVGGSWLEHLVYTGDEHHDGARTVDIDNDGDFDIVSIGFRDNPGGVFLYENKAGAGGNLPSAAPDVYAATEDTQLNVAAPGVLDNDSDPESDPLTAVLATNAANGTVNLNADGSFTYTPDPDFNGQDSFTYQATDSTTFSEPAEVTLNVAPANDPPVATAQSVFAEDGTPLGIALTGTDIDGDPLTFNVTVQPAHGSLSGSEPNVVYTSDPGYAGPDSFMFTASDASETSPAATVDITVLPPNDPPVGNADAYSVDEDNVLNVAAPGVLGNDVDPEGDPITAGLISTTSDGVLALNSDGSFTYTPTTDFNGQDTFVYRASDALDSSGDTLVTITVNSINDVPVADGQTIAVDEDVPTLITLTASDADLDPLTFTVTVQPVNGTLSGSAPSLTYTPDPGYSGPDSFSFTASDASATSAPAVVQINVSGISFGLVGHWSFNAGTAVDDSGSGNDGTVNGASAVTGHIGAGAMEFDGTDDYVDVGNIDVPGAALSLATWINADTFSNCAASDCRIVSKASGTDTEDHYIMLSTISSSGIKLRFRLKAGGSTETLVAASGDLTPGQWIHIAATYDGAFMRVYVDGTEVGSTAKTGAIDTNASVPMWFGGNPPFSTDRPWDGKIDDVRLYNRVLDIGEIQQLAAGDAVGVTISGNVSLFGVVTGTAAFSAIAPEVTIDSGPGPQVVSVALDGTFSILAADGVYTITASAPGFLSQQRLDLVVAGADVAMPPVQLVAGLVDGDQFVSGADLSAILAAIGSTLVGRTNGIDSNIIDLNADGVVNGLDSSVVATNFGESSPQSGW